MSDFCDHNRYLGFGARLALQGRFNAAGEFVLHIQEDQKKPDISQNIQPTIISNQPVLYPVKDQHRSVQMDPV